MEKESRADFAMCQRDRAVAQRPLGFELNDHQHNRGFCFQRALLVGLQLVGDSGRSESHGNQDSDKETSDHEHTSERKSATNYSPKKLIFARIIRRNSSRNNDFARSNQGPLGICAPLVRRARLRYGWKMLLEKSQNICIRVEICAAAFGNTVRAAGINAHIKLFSERNKFIPQQLESLEMYVVVAGPVNHQQTSAQAAREINRRTFFVRLRTILRQSQITFLVNCVVQTLVGN